MDKARQAQLRSRLESSRDQLQAEITELRDVAVKATTYLEDESEIYDEDSAGDATSMVGRQTDMTLLYNLQGEFEAIEAALKRMDDSTYGACEVCGNPIAEKRLEARPAAITCIECQSALESRHRRENAVNAHG